MGEANRRGTFEERQTAAIKRKELARAEEEKRQAERRRLQDEYFGHLPAKRQETAMSKPVRARRMVSLGVGLSVASCLNAIANKVA